VTKLNAQAIPVNSNGVDIAIDLVTVLKLGGANNLTIKEFKQKKELALANVLKEKEWWLPDLYVGTTIHQLWGNAMAADGTIFTDVDRQYFSGGIGINASWDFGDGIYKVNGAEFRAKAAEHQTQAEQNKALLEIINTYYDFLSAQMYYNTYQELLITADTIIDQIQIQVEADLRYQSELLLAKSNFNHLKVEMLNAQIECNNRSASLVKLLNIDPTVRLVAAENILAPLELVDIYSEKEWLDSTYNSRPEFRSSEFILRALNTEKKTTTTGLLIPEVRLGAYGSYFGGVFSPMDPTSAINASLIWEIPFGRLIYKGSLKQYNAKIALQKNSLEQIKATINEEVISAREKIRTIKLQMELSREGIDLSKEALKQSLARQNIHTVRPFEIVQVQEVYIKSQLDYIKSVASYNKAQYAYFVATGNDL
jgi:outer membrane protein TolC